MNPRSVLRFRNSVYITLLLTYLVILAGAVVRTTQSGMGCPDWPKCFGQWVPPTSESQLPMNYQEIYAHRGYADTQFNAFHTWVEYVNRLLGAILGFAVFIMLLLSFSYYKERRSIVWLSFLIFILIGFQGWLGSLVVASNLAPVKITVHMLMALVLLAALSLVYRLADNQAESIKVSASLKNWLYLALAFTAVQVLLGTQVRQEIDVIAKQFEHLQREKWIDQLSALFKFHRSFSLLILALNAYILYQVNKVKSNDSAMNGLLYQIALVLGAELLAGIILSYFQVPAAVQPIHLLLASLLFGLQFKLVLGVKS